MTVNIYIVMKFLLFSKPQKYFVILSHLKKINVINSKFYLKRHQNSQLILEMWKEKSDLSRREEENFIICNRIYNHHQYKVRNKKENNAIYLIITPKKYQAEWNLNKEEAVKNHHPSTILQTN